MAQEMAEEKAKMFIESKVREVLREKELRTSEEFLTAFNEHIHAALKAATDRCKENGRATLRPQDI
jgi:histone H3/H4